MPVTTRSQSKKSSQTRVQKKLEPEPIFHSLTIAENDACKIFYHAKFYRLFGEMNAAMTHVEKCKLMGDFYKFLNENYTTCEKCVPFGVYLQSGISQQGLKKSIYEKAHEIFNEINRKLVSKKFTKNELEIICACSKELITYIQVQKAEK